MSWLTNITGKAEQFLNKIDQSAAQALHKEEEERLNLSLPLTSDVTSLGSPAPSAKDRVQERAAYSVPSKLSAKKESNPPLFASTAIKSNNSQQSGVSGGSNTAKPNLKSAKSQSDTAVKGVPQGGNIPEQKASPSTGSAKKKLDTDEALFDFLNSSEPAEATKKKVVPVAPPPESVSRHSRQSSTSSVISNKGGKSNADTPVSTSGSSLVHVESVPTGTL